MKMNWSNSLLVVASLIAPAAALADNPPFGNLGNQVLDTAKSESTKAVKGEVNKEVISRVNKRLMAEGRKNQCSFKKDTDELEAGCDAKAKRLADTMINLKKDLTNAGLQSYKFVVSGHTDTFGTAEHNKELSQKRAAVMVRELVARGVSAGEIEAVGMGAERPIVKPDNTEAKRAKNRRYEIQVKI